MNNSRLITNTMPNVSLTMPMGMRMYTSMSCTFVLRGPIFISDSG
jgi:hypothetical protein